jgi:hypothetical protein
MIAIRESGNRIRLIPRKARPVRVIPARASTLWWLGQLPVSGAVVRLNDDRPPSLKRVLKARNKDGDKDSDRTFCFPH